MYSIKFNYLLIFCLFIGISSCIEVPNQYEGLVPGYYRAVMDLVPQKLVMNEKGDIVYSDEDFKDIQDGQLPFVFEVIYENENDFYIDIINGEERMRVDDIKFGRDRTTGDDTLLIEIPYYDSYIRAKYKANVVQGVFVAKNRKNYSIPLIAKHGKDYRFTTLKKEPALDLSGKWESTFELGTKDEYKAIGEFKQKGNNLTGTFMTETGDYRFLEGTVQGNKFWLSCFDGSHLFLFEGKINEDETLIGTFKSGKHYTTSWSAKKNENFELGSPEDLTFLKEGYDSFDFTFENEKGETISINDEKYKGKVKLVQILGTWCPNCRDETRFLVDYLKNNNSEELEVIALAFEKHREEPRAKKAIKTYKEKFEIKYEMLLAGYSNKTEAGEKLPMLNEIISYPTLLFIDKNNKVRKIHTGFAGPATSKYDSFTKEFKSFVAELIKE